VKERHPAGMAARVRVNGRLGGVEAQGDFTRRDDVYVTPDFGSAQNRVNINSDRGFGRLVIRHVSE
jgi:hypothetical protein